MRTTSRWLGGLALAALWTGSAWAAPAPESKYPNQIPIIPGGVADADGAKGFVANADGGITDLDLETGKALWESKTAGRPLAVMGGWVWVQTRDKDKANVLRIVGLKLDDGKAATQSDPITLPDWASAEPGRNAGRSFSSHAWMDKKEALLMIAWKADTFYWGGAAPPPEVLKASQRHADGVARVNLITNEVEMLETAKAPSQGPKVSDSLRNAAARNYGDEGRLTVATVGDSAVAVDVEPAAGKQKVVLKRWDLKTEKPLDPVMLAEGAMFQVVALPSAGVALVRDATPPVPFVTEQTWTVYALTTGKETGRFTVETAAEDFSVVGPRVYYVVKGPLKGPPFGGVLPRTLKAVDWKTGKRLWELPLEGERLPPPPPP
jgi:hypothetical protein